MATTLLASNSPIGIGIMALEMANHLVSIDSVIVVEYEWYAKSEKLVFPDSKVVRHVNYKDAKTALRPMLRELAADPFRKMLYIESSWGVSRLFPRDRNYLIPMWEQSSVEPEAHNCANVLSVTKFGQSMMATKGISSRYLPFPVETQTRKDVGHLRTILHNAGSYGGDFRKGTPEAIQIFQESGLSKDGVSLVVTALKPPNDYLRTIVEANPDGIHFDIGFKESWQQLYSSADLLLYPSRVEGHSLPVLESNSFGIPALATNFGPINEYDPTEEFSLSVDYIKYGRARVNISEGAMKLRQIARQGVAKKSLSVHQSVLDNFTWEKLGSRYNSILL